MNEVIRPIIADIYDEIDRAEAMHGRLPGPVRAVVILTEEVGECAQAALGLTREPAEDTEAHLREELVQVAAVAIRMIANIDRRD